jgi:SAM-dependent methyltransferase
VVVGVDPSGAFVAHARSVVDDPRAQFREGGAAVLPLDDGSAYVVVSGLVLNFVPHAEAGLREMTRVARPAGIIAGYVWDYAGEMQLIRRLWDAAGAPDPMDEDPVIAGGFARGELRPSRGLADARPRRRRVGSR